MGNHLDRLLSALKSSLDANDWIYFGWLPVPNSDDAWLLTFVAMSAISLIVAASDPIRSLLFRNFKAQQWELCITSKNDDSKDKDSWNIIEMRKEDVEGSRGLKLDKNKVYNTVVVEIREGWKVRTHMARLRINQQHLKGKISIHRTLAEKLGMRHLLDADATQDDACSARLDFNVRHPSWYLLAPFWKHPDPNIRLQWQMSFLFLVLGIALPKLLESLLK